MAPDGDRDDDVNDDEVNDDDAGLRAFQIDADTVRVNNPDPKEPDKIVRRLKSGEVRTYDARKKKD